MSDGDEAERANDDTGQEALEGYALFRATGLALFGPPCDCLYCHPQRFDCELCRTRHKGSTLSMDNRKPRVRYGR